MKKSNSTKKTVSVGTHKLREILDYGFTVNIKAFGYPTQYTIIAFDDQISTMARGTFDRTVVKVLEQLKKILRDENKSL